MNTQLPICTILAAAALIGLTSPASAQIDFENVIVSYEHYVYARVENSDRLKDHQVDFTKDSDGSPNAEAQFFSPSSGPFIGGRAFSVRADVPGVSATADTSSSHDVALLYDGMDRLRGVVGNHSSTAISSITGPLSVANSSAAGAVSVPFTLQQPHTFDVWSAWDLVDDAGEFS